MMVLYVKHITCSNQMQYAYSGPQRENFPGGTKVDTVTRNFIAPPSLIGAHAVKSFFVRCLQIYIWKRGDNDIRIQLGPLKNTTRHKIGLNPARGSEGALWAPPAGSGAEPWKL